MASRESNFIVTVRYYPPHRGTLTATIQPGLANLAAQLLHIFLLLLLIILVDNISFFLTIMYNTMAIGYYYIV